MQGAVKQLHIGRARTLALALAVAALAGIPMVGLGAGGTILFTGAVTENSCTVRVQDAASSDGTVALPVVDTAALARAGQPEGTAAGTFFRIELAACTLNHADISGNVPTQVAVYFEAGPNVDPVSHALINTGSSNVVVKLFEASGPVGVGRQIIPGVPGSVTPLSGPGTWHFYAGYALAGPGQPTAGSVNTTVTYSLVYE
jgi:major type 1 subunit fimbrin (pilin)